MSVLPLCRSWLQALGLYFRMRALELRKGEQDVEYEPSHRVGGIE
jgi:hypothetical protein